MKGITFIELMITLSVLFILTLLSIPLFNTVIQNYRLTTSAQNLYTALQYARTEAIKRNKTIFVSFTTGDSWCFGINPDSACNCTISGNCLLGTFSANAAQQNTLSMTGFSGNNIQFEATRAAANSSGTVRLTKVASSTYIEIAIGRLGGLKICSNEIARFTTC